MLVFFRLLQCKCGFYLQWGFRGATNLQNATMAETRGWQGRVSNGHCQYYRHPVWRPRQSRGVHSDYSFFQLGPEETQQPQFHSQTQLLMTSLLFIRCFIIFMSILISFYTRKLIKTLLFAFPFQSNFRKKFFFLLTIAPT